MKIKSKYLPYISIISLLFISLFLFSHYMNSKRQVKTIIFDQTQNRKNSNNKENINGENDEYKKDKLNQKKIDDKYKRQNDWKEDLDDLNAKLNDLTNGNYESKPSYHQQYKNKQNNQKDKNDKKNENTKNPRENFFGYHRKSKIEELLETEMEEDDNTQSVQVIHKKNLKEIRNNHLYFIPESIPSKSKEEIGKHIQKLLLLPEWT